MSGMIKSVDELTKLSRDELDELLLEPQYTNRAILREMIRRLLTEVKNYKNLYAQERKNTIEFKQELTINQCVDVIDTAAHRLNLSREDILSLVENKL